MQITDAIGGVYDVDSLGAKLATIKTTDRFARTSPQNTVLANVALDLVDEAVAQDDYDSAKELTGLALAAARKARAWQLVKRIVARDKAVKEATETHAQVQAALATLENDSTDANANQAAGEYFCFVKGDWNQGIPMLALGSNTKLKAVATRDLRQANTAEEQDALGDAWWTLAEGREGRERESVMLRAGFWYQQAEPNLGGLVAQKIAKRTAQIAKRTAQIAKLDLKIPTPPPFEVEAEALAEQINALGNGTEKRASQLGSELVAKLERIWPIQADSKFTLGSRGRQSTTGAHSAEWFGYGGAGNWKVFPVEPNRRVLLRARGDGQLVDDIRFTISEQVNGKWTTKETINGPTSFAGYRWYFYTPETERIRIDATGWFYIYITQL